MNAYLWTQDADEIVKEGWGIASAIDVDGTTSILLTDRPSSEGEQTVDTSYEQLLTLEVPDELFAKFEQPAFRMRESVIPVAELNGCGKPRIVSDDERASLWELQPWYTPEQREAERKEKDEGLKRFRERMWKMKKK